MKEATFIVCYLEFINVLVKKNITVDYPQLFSFYNQKGVQQLQSSRIPLTTIKNNIFFNMILIHKSGKSLYHRFHPISTACLLYKIDI